MGAGSFFPSSAGRFPAAGPFPQQNKSKKNDPGENKLKMNDSGRRGGSGRIRFVRCKSGFCYSDCPGRIENESFLKSNSDCIGITVSNFITTPVLEDAGLETLSR